MDNRILASVFCIAVLACPSFAWDAATYQHIGEQILLKYYPHCKDKIDQGAVYPDSIEKVNASLGESLKQHCDMAPGLGTCPAYDSAYCESQVRTCNATVEAAKWIQSAQGKCCCDQAFALATASNYFASHLAVMHQIIHEDSDLCHKAFETKISDAIASGQANWSVTHKCTHPDREFTFTSNDLREIVFRVETGIIHQDFRSYYCDTCQYEAPVKNAAGQNCSKDTDCESGYCDLRVAICCSGGTCCRTPGNDGYPCVAGQVCSGNFSCAQKNLRDGNECKTNMDCTSKYCAPGTASGTTKFCCSGSAGQSCCSRDSDCLSGEKCAGNMCVVGSVTPNGTGPGTGPGTQQPGNGEAAQGKLCPLFLIPLVLLAAVFFRKTS